MARPHRGRTGIPGWIWGGLVATGLASIGFGLWSAAHQDDAKPPQVAAAAPTGPTPPAAGAPSVAPGTVELDQDAPAETRPPESKALCAGCDVVLITVCSLRKDYVGAYGQHAELTPSIDRIAADGYRFTHAYSASNFTLAGLTAVLTGRFGSSTGVTGWDKGLVADIPTLPEVLGYYGYRTGAFTIDAPSGFRPDYGLHRGFQRMQIIESPPDNPDGRFRGGDIGDGGLSAIPVSEWIGTQAKDRPIFAMFHSRTAHFPFVVSQDGADQDPTGITRGLFEAGMSTAKTRKAGQAMPGMAGGTGQQGVVDIGGPDPLQVIMDEKGAPAEAMWRQRYGEAVHRMDRDVARVFAALEARGTLDRTVILLVADHGESLNDHGELLHGDAYYDGVVNVPLLVRVPGLPGSRQPIDALVSHVDVLPTILELIGATAPAGIDGASLLPLLQGRSDAIRTTALVEGGVAKQIGGVPRGAVVSLPWTLLRQQRGCGGSIDKDPPRNGGEPATCLFDVVADPGQTTNQAKQHPEVVADLMKRWNDFRADHGGGAAGTDLNLDPKYVQELHKTGYDFRPSQP
jgi:arylsulfatase A-like enzyme